ncbi:MAG: dTDP-4-dehydrorhamnose 3,5-epimerase [Candidatus Zambryskibacteria bacterium RIFCSPHIGHO2_01_FULL_44_22b]|uniref:dTDP-4-dehydrorhamnose 3,5-epimerase n=1 Tax=Candidatus Zambryskibacteria bacterium RIFCSPHIGHO2_01_FULL_44_22b TaxID=1802737 RepID=A0A1G2T4B0_9BACT|nr:MAG: dTDP-4-dehydrorhamnose 3,5-epimerase [Candidatus Staskawiczbacteria bacterium RIFCSPLOWO2_01_FULL_40_39]OHA91431.1 MAG: dTDP-4-dehydrorhamnose 3,5-epimerase [Candidatus Zambryskibacteria bacterium RIFCSPHIGHO2_01_FULL_44_22b]
MTLNYKKLRIPDLLLIEPKVFLDERGFFLEKYKQSDFEEIGLPLFKQDNFSVSKQNVIRGLHYQASPFEQGKIVSIVAGKVWDVAVDIRENSETFGQWQGVELSEENNLSFYIPPGFAHGFSVLSEEAKVLYKCTAEYSQIHERGIRFDDPDLSIDWKVINPIVSNKDKIWPQINAKK